MPDIRCDECGEPIHRYGYPTDADGHDPSLTACLNVLRATRDELVKIVAKAANRGDDESRWWLRKWVMSGQGMRYPDRFQEGNDG